MRPVRAVRLGTGVAVAAAIAAVAVVALSSGAPQTAYRQTYVQFNLCGNACSRGALSVITNLETAIGERRPFAVTLNEVCENQYAKLRADLLAYEGRFDPTGPTCRNGARYGNAVFVRATDVRMVGSWELPNPAGDETRRLMCLSTRLPGAPTLAICVTHVSNVADNIAPQVSAVAGILNGLDDGNAVLLGGDVNTDPADVSMDPLYSSCYESGAGGFREADSGGCASRSLLNQQAGSDVINEDTYGRHKFDYVFLSDGDWSSTRANTSDTSKGLSDHDALWVSATFSS